MKDTEHIYKIAVGIHYGQTQLELRRLIRWIILTFKSLYAPTGLT
jgi:hypothetical protein